MDTNEREKRLKNVEDVLRDFLSDNKYAGLSASYFAPHCFARDNQGIHCAYSGNDESVVADLLGFLDIPAMMNGLLLESVRSPSSGQLHVFVYDDDKFHVDNLKKLNIMNTDEILSKKR